MKYLLSSVIALLTLAPLAASAGYVNPRVIAADERHAAAIGMFGGGIMMLTLLTFMGLVIGLLVLWVWMLIDALKREWPEKSSWLAILILSLFAGLHWLSAVLYYVLVKQKNVGTMPSKKQ
jgi:hypothetical protein